MFLIRCKAILDWISSSITSLQDSSCSRTLMWSSSKVWGNIIGWSSGTGASLGCIEMFWHLSMKKDFIYCLAMSSFDFGSSGISGASWSCAYISLALMAIYSSRVIPSGLAYSDFSPSEPELWFSLTKSAITLSLTISIYSPAAGSFRTPAFLNQVVIIQIYS